MSKVSWWAAADDWVVPDKTAPEIRVSNPVGISEWAVARLGLGKVVYLEMTDHLEAGNYRVVQIIQSTIRTHEKPVVTSIVLERVSPGDV